jgi:hypothetical protein
MGLIVLIYVIISVAEIIKCRVICGYLKRKGCGKELWSDLRYYPGTVYSICICICGRVRLKWTFKK